MRGVIARFLESWYAGACSDVVMFLTASTVLLIHHSPVLHRLGSCNPAPAFTAKVVELPPFDSSQ